MVEKPKDASTPATSVENRLPKLLRIAKSALPTSVGVALANICFNVTLNDSSLHFSNPFMQNGTLFVSIVCLALFMLWLARGHVLVSPGATQVGILCCIVVEALSAAGLGLLEFALSDVSILRFVCVVLMYLSSLGSLAFWLRCERGATAGRAALVVFGAVLMSAPFICGVAFLSHCVAYALLVVAGLAQALCLYVMRARPLPAIGVGRVWREQDNEVSTNEAEGRIPSYKKKATDTASYFCLTETVSDDQSVLITTAIGIWMLSLAKAVIRVFPTGQPIPYTQTTLMVDFVISMVITVLLLWFALNKRNGIMTVGIWLVMLNLAIVALLVCGFFPENLDVGLGFAYALDVLLLAYTWYVALAFINYGRRDPFYYLAGGFIAYLLPRSLTNVVMPTVLGGIDQAAAAATVAAALLLLCAQFLFLQFPRLPEVSSRAEKKEHPLSQVAARAFGIDTPADTSTAMRVAIMQSHAHRMQKQFLLSDREAEVLALYALGHTQDKIAADLFLSPGTVHTYIKRIYGKTNFHSRQTILDYIENDSE